MLAICEWINGLVFDLSAGGTLLGLVLVWIQLREQQRSNRENTLKERRQILNVLSSSLECIGAWAGQQRGGYPATAEQLKALIENKQLQNPFHNIFELNNPLTAIAVLPGMVHFKKDFQEALVGLNQAIISFNSSLRRIYQFALAKPDEAIGVHLKLIGVVKEKMTPDEGLLANKVLELFVLLHRDVIGDKNGRGLHYWHDRLRTAVEAEIQTLTEDMARAKHPVLWKIPRLRGCLIGRASHQ